MPVPSRWGINRALEYLVPNVIPRRRRYCFRSAVETDWNSLGRNPPNGILLWCYLHSTAGLDRLRASIRASPALPVVVHSEERHVFKDLFRFSSEGDAGTHETPKSADAAGHTAAIADLAEALEKSSAEGSGNPAKAALFERIYQSAAAKPPRLPYGILKVAEMLDNRHLVGMAPETKRSALLMALDAAGAGIDDLLQDAVLRQRALNDYDEAQQRHLREFEALKASENTTVQANLDRLTREHMSRIQSNLDSVAREQDKVRNWQRMKRQESQRIADAAAFCVPPNGPGGGLAQVLERATTARR